MPATTADALAQAEKDPRIRILYVRDLPPDVVGTLMDSIKLVLVRNATRTTVRFLDDSGACIGPPGVGIDCRIDGDTISPQELLAPLMEDVKRYRAYEFLTEEPDVGQFEMSAEAGVYYDGLVVNGRTVAEVQLSIDFIVDVVIPTVAEGYHIADRGTHITSEPFDSHGVRISFVPSDASNQRSGPIDTQQVHVKVESDSATDSQPRKS